MLIQSDIEHFYALLSLKTVLAHFDQKTDVAY